VGKKVIFWGVLGLFLLGGCLFKATVVAGQLSNEGVKTVNSGTEHGYCPTPTELTKNEMELLRGGASCGTACNQVGTCSAQMCSVSPCYLCTGGQAQYYCNKPSDNYACSGSEDEDGCGHVWTNGSCIGHLCHGGTETSVECGLSTCTEWPI
jgi:hypothetical protein